MCIACLFSLKGISCPLSNTVYCVVHNQCDNHAGINPMDKLKVQELREELQMRGIDVTGKS